MVGILIFESPPYPARGGTGSCTRPLFDNAPSLPYLIPVTLQHTYVHSPLPAVSVHVIGGSVMRRSPAFAAIAFLALGYVQVHAQTAAQVPSKATRIEYAAPYAAMDITSRAILTDGIAHTPLVFAEAPAQKPYWPFSQSYVTNRFVVGSGMRIASEACTVMRVTGMPPDPHRIPLQVTGSVYVTLVDAVSGKVLLSVLPRMSCETASPMDTLMSHTGQIDLSPYAGRTVYLNITVCPDPTGAMTESRQVTIHDCTETQPLNTIKGHVPISVESLHGDA